MKVINTKDNFESTMRKFKKKVADVEFYKICVIVNFMLSQPLLEN